MNIWFTSDQHYKHNNIIKHCHRPFSSLEEMHEVLTDNWNNVVGSSDLVYCLGDFFVSWGKQSRSEIDSLLRKLNGNKFLIIGNHDRKEVTQSNLWNQVVYYKELKVDRGSKHRQKIILFHYPIKSWNQIHRGSWMLHGHCHGNLDHPDGLIMDVGVDCHNYKPLHIDQVADFMSRRNIVTYDHHEV